MGRKSAEGQHRAAADGLEHSDRHDGAAPSSIYQLVTQIGRSIRLETVQATFVAFSRECVFF